MLKKFFLSEKNMMIAIALNAMVICLLYFPNIHSDKNPNVDLVNLDHLFILLFLIEAIVKISVMKPKGYFSDAWNVFDFIIVFVSLPGLLTLFHFSLYTITGC